MDPSGHGKTNNKKATGPNGTMRFTVIVSSVANTKLKTKHITCLISGNNSIDSARNFVYSNKSYTVVFIEKSLQI
jgi:hypothetical protein